MTKLTPNDIEAFRFDAVALCDIDSRETLMLLNHIAAIETENAKLLDSLTKLSLDAEQCGAKLMTNPPICHRAHIARLALAAVSDWVEKP